MSKLEHLIPPPAVLLFTLIAMFVISRFDRLRILRVDEYAINIVIATALVVVGISVAMLGIKQFKITQTTINPLKPYTVSNLVTSGVYRFTRNPMYLGMVLIALGSVSFYGSAWCLIAIVGFIAFITRFQIIPEERAMALLFGQKFDAYRAATRRWI